MEPQEAGTVPPQSSAPFTPLTVQKATIGYTDSGWSWGAFLLGPMFIVGIRRYAYLWMFLLWLIPFVNLLTIPALMIYLGVSGREMARQSKTFASQDEYLGYIKGIDHGAKVYFLAAVTIAALVFLVSSVFIGLLGSSFN